MTNDPPVEGAFSDTVHYFRSAGRHNMGLTMALVRDALLTHGIKVATVFTRDGTGPLRLRELLDAAEARDTHVVAVAFPHFERLRDDQGDGYRIPETSQEHVEARLRERSITLVRGTWAFQDILFPGVPDTKLAMIAQTLTKISAGLRLCVESVLMACDAGAIKPQERVVAAAADTAIIAYASTKQLFFHPREGFFLERWICLPSGHPEANESEPRSNPKG